MSFVSSKIFTLHIYIYSYIIKNIPYNLSLCDTSRSVRWAETVNTIPDHSYLAANSWQSNLSYYWHLNVRWGSSCLLTTCAPCQPLYLLMMYQTYDVLRIVMRNLCPVVRNVTENGQGIWTWKWIFQKHWPGVCVVCVCGWRRNCRFLSFVCVLVVLQASWPRHRPMFICYVYVLIQLNGWYGNLDERHRIGWHSKLVIVMTMYMCNTKTQWTDDFQLLRITAIKRIVQNYLPYQWASNVTCPTCDHRCWNHNKKFTAN